MSSSTPSTIVVTGATSGIGEAASLHLARENHHVIMAGRTPSTTEAARQRIAAEVPHARLDVVAGDLETVQGMHAVSARIAELTPHLDGLALNAGIAAREHRETDDGLDAMFAVNAVAPLVLAHDLLPLLRSSGRGRIVLTGSSDHLAVKEIDVSSAASGRSFRFTRNYAETKLIAMLSMFEMARRLAGQGVLINVADPGWTRTNLTRSSPMPLMVMVRVMKPMQNSVMASGELLARLATLPPDDTTNGVYLGIKGPSRLSQLATDPEARKRVHDELVSVIGDRGLARPDEFVLS